MAWGSGEIAVVDKKACGIEAGQCDCVSWRKERSFHKGRTEMTIESKIAKGMTVGELIEKLSRLPQDVVVLLEDDQSLCYNNFLDVKYISAEEKKVASRVDKYGHSGYWSYCEQSGYRYDKQEFVSAVVIS
jgi:hypothetical protein